MHFIDDFEFSPPDIQLGRQSIKVKCCSMSRSRLLEHDIDLPFLRNVAHLGIPSIEIFGTTIALLFLGMKETVDDTPQIRIVFINSETHKVFTASGIMSFWPFAKLALFSNSADPALIHLGSL